MYCLQVDFPANGPFGAEMTAAYGDLAKSIATEKGIIWKIWTENAEAKEAGGIYLFDTKENAEAYLAMHSARLTQWGVQNIRSKIFLVNEALSAITGFAAPAKTE